MTRPLRVFLCHSSNDKPTVRELYQKLRAEPWIEPWLDEEELYPGQDWNMEIEKAVEAADAIIVCLSKGSITKEGYVQRELRSVLDFADYKPEGTLYIIPVRLEECEPPRRLRAWQYADYFEGQRERAFQRLLISLKRRADALNLTAKEVEIKQIEEPAKQAAPEKAPKQITPDLAKHEFKKESKRETSAKPYTKLIDPSTLAPKAITDSQLAKSAPNNNIRWLGIGGIILFVLLCGGFGLNYLIQNLPISTATSEIPTSTSALSLTATPQPTETPIPAPVLDIGNTKDGMVLVYVPAGEFLMGSIDADTLANSDEKPQHTVTLDAFWIDQTEVTNAMYAKCVSDGVCTDPLVKSSFTHPSYYRNVEFNNYPVIYVDWNKANAYCSWAERRLPTEAEWEKAARGTQALTYPWGNEPPNSSLLNYNSNIGDTTEAGKYPAGSSIYGALDMAGNVLEWTADWYSETYYQGSSSSNPLGPDSGQYRVLRGGSLYDDNYPVRSSTRFAGWGSPGDSNYGIGFRCARSP